jgi:hypothetical protein
MRDRLTDPALRQELRLRILRAQAARLMMSLHEVGLHEAAAHVLTGIQAIDRAASLENRGHPLGRLN